jgi:hypothetical protein
LDLLDAFPGGLSENNQKLDEYFRFKQRIQETYGFSYGFDYFTPIQAATESPGEDTMATSIS